MAIIEMIKDALKPVLETQFDTQDAETTGPLAVLVNHAVNRRPLNLQQSVFEETSDTTVVLEKKTGTNRQFADLVTAAVKAIDAIDVDTFVARVSTTWDRDRFESVLVVRHGQDNE